MEVGGGAWPPCVPLSYTSGAIVVYKVYCVNALLSSQRNIAFWLSTDDILNPLFESSKQNASLSE